MCTKYQIFKKSIVYFESIDVLLIECSQNDHKVESTELRNTNFLGELILTYVEFESTNEFSLQMEQALLNLQDFQSPL